MFAHTVNCSLLQDGWSDSKKQSFQDRRASTKAKAPLPKQPSVKKYSSDSDSDDDEEDTRDMEGRIVTKKGAEVSIYLFIYTYNTCKEQLCEVIVKFLAQGQLILDFPS